MTTDNPNNLPAMPPAAPTGTLEFDCLNPACPGPKGRKMRCVAPEPQVLNGPSASVIAYSHERGVSCNYCNAYYIIGIGAMEARIAWGVQPAERPAGIILPASGGVT